MTGDAVDAAIQDIAGRLDYPMFVVTAHDGERPAGCLVGFVTQCSISPPRFAVWISKANHTYGVATRSDLLTVHVVPPDGEALARLFGEKTGDEVDKFAACEWARNEEGGVVIDGAPDWFSGRVIDHVDGGDHEGFIVEPVAAASDGSGFFSFQQARDFEPGHPA